MEVTFIPVILSRRPVEDAESSLSETSNASRTCETRTNDTLTDTTDNASGDEDILHFTTETRNDRQRQVQAAIWNGCKSHSSLNPRLNIQLPLTMPPRPPTVEDAFDDDTDIPLPSRALPNTGARGALLEEVDSDDEMEIPTEPTQRPSTRSKPESRPTISKQSPEFEKMKRLVPYIVSDYNSSPIVIAGKSSTPYI